MYCGEQSAVKRESEGFTAVSLRCRAWTCCDCVDRRKRQLIAQAMSGTPCTFLTLTSRRDASKTPDQAALEISRAWRLVRLRLMRHFRWKKLPFLAVMEATELGWPHLHLLLRSRYIPVKLISKWMDEIIQSPVVWIEKIGNKSRVAGYCAKYCGKCAHKFGTAKRYWQSKDYDLREDKPEKPVYSPGWGWEMQTWSLDRIVRSWIELGWRVEMESQHKARVWFENAHAP